MSKVDIPLIDIHTHIGRLPGNFNDAYTPEDLCYIAEQEGALFMLTSSASTSLVSQSFGTTEAIEMVKKHGDKLGAMLWVNPRDLAWKADVERAVQYGFYGLKIHPLIDHYAVERAALDEVFACAQEHQWPILTHTHVDRTPMSAFCYEPLLKAYPDVVLILAHMPMEAMALARRYDNVYADITYLDPLTVEIGVAAVGADKILFGSDAAEGFDVGHTPGHVRPQRRSYVGLIEGFRQRGISEAELEKIAYLNAKRVFHITGV